ncbi:hypothetical protein EDB83DRAFT_2327333 [Lactarius deliciosus]|nr:hypothetical protein EDB83DRAFT_2327333 [Lactarius deliciosus]
MAIRQCTALNMLESACTKRDETRWLSQTTGARWNRNVYETIVTRTDSVEGKERSKIEEVGKQAYERRAKSKMVKETGLAKIGFDVKSSELGMYGRGRRQVERWRKGDSENARRRLREVDEVDKTRERDTRVLRESR